MKEFEKLWQTTSNVMISDNPAILVVVLVSSMTFGLIIKYIYSIYFLKNEPVDASIARSFPIIAPAVSSIFWLIQYSLPLSLGLLGALSFVRFRTPVKRAEDIAFILVVIATSLACAVQKIWVGLLVVICLIVYCYIRNKIIPFFSAQQKQALITLHTKEKTSTTDLIQIADLVFGKGVHLVSSSIHDDIQSIVFQVPNATTNKTETLTEKFREIDENSRIDIFYPEYNLGGY